MHTAHRYNYTTTHPRTTRLDRTKAHGRAVIVIGKWASVADCGQTLARLLGLPPLGAGTAFLAEYPQNCQN